MKRICLSTLFLALAAAFPARGFAQGTVIFHETADGIVAAIPTSSPALMFASDGEGGFDPFGAGFDTSDGMQLNGAWAPDPAFAASFAAGLWTDIGNSTWVLPATTIFGSENEPGYEPPAKWYFTPGSQWNPGTPSLLLVYSLDGALSDMLIVDDSGPNGSAAITFYSDPTFTPEPGSLTLLGLGLASFGGMAWMKRRQAKKVAA